MKRECALLIVNPHSRRCDDDVLREAVASLRRSGLEIVRAETRSRDEVGQTIHAHRDRVDRVIVAGGDGSINAAAEALYRTRLPLAILPLGTANDLARTLDIPEDMDSACEVILDNYRRVIDLGVANGQYFFNVANIGLGTRITRELTTEVKQHWGVLGYLKALVSALSGYHAFRLTLVADEGEQHLRSIQVAVGNGRFYGGGNVVDENAAIDDGLLSLFSLKPQSLRELITLAPLLRAGKHRQVPRIFNVSGRRIEVRTSRAMPVHADGEPLTRTPVVFEVREQALEVLAPEPVAQNNLQAAILG